MFKPATREQLKLRMALDGPAGSGKTYTALRFAFALAGKNGKVAVIDTEHRSASKYIGESPDGFPWQFDVAELGTYSPSLYTQYIRLAGQSGYDVLVIDSLSHAWSGVGGVLSQVDAKAKGFSGWKEVTPKHNDLVDAILGSPCHIIATMRTKTEYEVETANVKGKEKLKVTKLGTKPIQREGVEYEFDVVCDLSAEHLLTVSKTRCSALNEMVVSQPGPDFMKPLAKWLNAGVPRDFTPPSAEAQTLVPAPASASPTTITFPEESSPAVDIREQTSWRDSDPSTPEQHAEIVRVARLMDMPKEALNAAIAKRTEGGKAKDLSVAQADELLTALRYKCNEQTAPF